MGLFNEINVGRFNAVLHKMLSMKEGAPAPQLSGDIIPTLCLEGDRPEWAYLGGEHLCWGGSGQFAVAGEVSHIHLFNPSPNTLVVVEAIMVTAPSADTFISFGPKDSLLATPTLVASGFRDARLGRANQLTAAKAYRDTSAATQLDAATFSFYLGQSRPLVFPCAYILTENTGVCVQDTTANNTISCTFLWRERRLEESETR